jgi:hypothetical protein
MRGIKNPFHLIHPDFRQAAQNVPAPEVHEKRPVSVAKDVNVAYVGIDPEIGKERKESGHEIGSIRESGPYFGRLSPFSCEFLRKRRFYKWGLNG